jgi:hypothetical protein
MARFEMAKQRPGGSDFTQHAGDEFHAFAGVERVAMQRDGGGGSVSRAGVPPRKPNGWGGLSVTSKDTHETFVPEFGFMQVNAL